MPEVDLKKYEGIAEFNTTLVENMDLLSAMDNYYKWVGGLIRENTGKRILEVGCANGNLTRLFAHKPFVMGLDYSSEYSVRFKQRFKGAKNINNIVMDISNRKKALTLKKYKFDTVISMNTYEHIEDDVAAFKNTYDILEKNGRFVILVPAMEFLYSILDFEGGHFRRYTKEELASRLQSVGFKIEKLHYVNVAGALGWYVSHVLMKKRIYSKGSFWLYNTLVPVFKLVENVVKPPFGLSVICVARKPL